MGHVWDRRVELALEEWRGLAILGSALIVLGVLAIMASFAAALVTVFLLGCIVLAAAVIHALQAFHTRGWGDFLGHMLAMILYSVAGIYMITHPTDGAVSFTFLIGMLLAAGGFYQMVASTILRYKGWGWACGNGVVSLLMGSLIFAQWPGSSLWVIGTFVGVDLMFRGWAALMLSQSLRVGAKMFRARLPEGIMERRIGERRTGHKDRRQMAALS